MNHWITRAISSGLFQDDDASPAVPLPDAGIVPGGSLKVCSLFLGRAPHMGFPGTFPARSIAPSQSPNWLNTNSG